MLVIQEFDRKALKDEIVLNRKMKTLPVPRSLSREDRSKRRKINEETKKMYTARRIPCRIGDLIIDFALYQQFLKKLRGFITRTEVTETGIKVVYSKPYSTQKGELELHDLSSYFGYFTSLPLARLDHDT